MSGSRRPYLDVYLNDHLAGSTAGLALARRAVRHAPDDESRGALRRLAAEIESDRESLEEVMRLLGSSRSGVKVAAGAVTERLARLKPNGALFGASPLSPMIELEALSLGVEGKIALWRCLRELSAVDELSERLDVLIDRGEAQRAELERMRLLASRRVFDEIRTTDLSSRSMPAPR